VPQIEEKSKEQQNVSIDRSIGKKAIYAADDRIFADVRQNNAALRQRGH